MVQPFGLGTGVLAAGGPMDLEHRVGKVGSQRRHAHRCSIAKRSLTSKLTLTGFSPGLTVIDPLE